MAKGLSEQDLMQFTKIVRDHEEKNRVKENKENLSVLLEGREFSTDNLKHEKLLEDRLRLLSMFNFSQQDKEIVQIINSSDYHLKEYYGFFYVMTSLDHQSLVEKSISIDSAILDKFLYLLTVNFKEDAELESRKTVLYQLIHKIHDFMNYAALAPDYESIEVLNHVLSMMAALLIAVPYEKLLLDYSYGIGFNPNKTGQKFCLIIPPNRMETPIFKEINNFYHDNIAKKVMQKTAYLEYKKMETEQDKGMFSRKKKLDHLFDDLKLNLNVKLDNLRKKGGYF